MCIIPDYSHIESKWPKLARCLPLSFSMSHSFHFISLYGNECLSQGCQMAKFDPFLSLDCARVEGGGAQSKERKGSNFAA